MLSPQMNQTFRALQRMRAGNMMLGPMSQQHLMARTAPNTLRMNTTRQVNARAIEPYMAQLGLALLQQRRLR